MTIGQALKRLGVRGLAGAARDVLAPPRPGGSGARRAPYRVEHDVAAGVKEPKSETLPIDAAAALAGLHGFLIDLPVLSERRAAIQSNRRAADQDVVSRFREHWLNPGPAPFQLEYNAVHAILVQEFAIESLSRPSATGDPVEASVRGAS
jgi:hypothetical protein